jgi:hypothetical protein
MDQPQITDANHDSINSVNRDDFLRIFDSLLGFDLGDDSHMLIHHAAQRLQHQQLER